MTLCYPQCRCVRHRRASCRPPVTASRTGFTLVEVLAATALALLMMGTVVSMFAIIGDSVSGSRATVEMTERLRATQLMLQRDLAGITGGEIAPSRRPDYGDGYFEYIEGPIGPVMSAFELGEFPAANSMPDSGAAITDEGTPDTTVGDFDDVLMFTTRSGDVPFVGRAHDINSNGWAPAATVESQVAEVCWFMRGSTLYRRQLLVIPSLQRALAARLAPLNSNDVYDFLADFYARNDLSVHMEGGPLDPRAAGAKPPRPTLVLNTLGDLTKRENRYGHQPFAFPHDARFWSILGLPTLRDCCNGSNAGNYVWPFPFVPSGDYELIEHNLGSSPELKRTIVAPADMLTGKVGGTGGGRREVWHVLFNDPANPADVYVPYARNLWAENDPSLASILNNPGYANDTTRVSDDIIMNNVLSFDVEVWDPGAPIYQTLNDSGAIVSIVPGDVAYAAAVRRDMASRNNSNQPTGGFGPVSFGAFVDLNYMARLDTATLPDVIDKWPHYRAPTLPELAPEPDFHHAGDRGSFLRGTRPSNWGPGVPVVFEKLKASVYCTWSTHYEHDGLNQDAAESNHIGGTIIDQGTNGLDDATTEIPINLGSFFAALGADDKTEREAPPPYDAPVKAIRVKIRVFEPDSEQIREVTVVQDF